MLRDVVLKAMFKNKALVNSDCMLAKSNDSQYNILGKHIWDQQFRA